MNLKERNKKIFGEWLEGVSVRMLSDFYNPSEKSIKKIVLSQIPLKVRLDPVLRKDDFHKWKLLLKMRNEAKKNAELEQENKKNIFLKDLPDMFYTMRAESAKRNFNKSKKTKGFYVGWK